MEVQSVFASSQSLGERQPSTQRPKFRPGPAGSFRLQAREPWLSPRTASGRAVDVARLLLLQEQRHFLKF